MTPVAASDGKIKVADLLFVGGADVEVAQKCPAHFVSQFGVGAPVVAGSGKKKDRCGPREETGKKRRGGEEKKSIKDLPGKDLKASRQCFGMF